MKYSEPKADLRNWIPLVRRKSTIITLLAMLLIFITFQRVQVKPLKVQEYQTTIEVEDVPITKQEIQKQEAPKPRLAEVIETEDEEQADTVEIATTELDVEEPPPEVPTQVDEVDWVKVEIKPKVLSTPKPKYPDIAKKSGLEGAVIVEFVIDTTGDVLPGSAKIVAARPEGIFEEAALNAIYKWKFSPGQQRDRKVRVRWRQPIKFTLK
ncbi:hypothetical protein DRQ26_01410 [bacterium]|nr:MAG: hypothetical protein DRQ26_01410 [bacterium]